MIAKPGDEIALDFDARLTPATDGHGLRTYLLLADGYSKEMDINSASPDTVEPLPFHAMTRYPYRATEHYPDGPEHRALPRNLQYPGRREAAPVDRWQGLMAAGCEHGR